MKTQFMLQNIKMSIQHLYNYIRGDLFIMGVFCTNIHPLTLLLLQTFNTHLSIEHPSHPYHPPPPGFEFEGSVVGNGNGMAQDPLNRHSDTVSFFNLTCDKEP